MLQSRRKWAGGGEVIGDGVGRVEVVVGWVEAGGGGVGGD